MKIPFQCTVQRYRINKNPNVMYIEIDDQSGFCFGVVKAITKAEESLQAGEKVYSLGDIVHNRVEVQRLEQLG